MTIGSRHAGQKIIPFIWCDNTVEEAAEHYASLFADGRIIHVSRYSEAGKEAHGQRPGAAMVAAFEVAGLKISALNGGPAFKPNPSISFFVELDSADEVRRLWDGLSTGGDELMALGSYPWSQCYGWVSDRYNVSWQVSVRLQPSGEPTVRPSLLFTGDNMGRAAEAQRFYTDIFPDSAVGLTAYRDASDADAPGTVLFGQFDICGQGFNIMDAPGSHGFSFTEGVSLMVSCDTQAEIDRYWDALTADGGAESQCGWLKDKFGVSWQITPTIMQDLMASRDQARADSLMTAMLKMKKLDIATLEAAARGSL